MTGSEAARQAQLAGKRLLLVGVPRPGHVGQHLVAAAAELGITCQVVDESSAFELSLKARVLRRVRGEKYLARRASFPIELLTAARELRPHYCVVTGSAPVFDRELRTISALGARLVYFSTDDPWNPLYSEPRLFRSLRAYDVVFTPRAANVGQLRQLGVERVEQLAFGYDPVAHRKAAASEIHESPFAADAVFIGGADEQRVPYMQALASSGLDLVLFGGYWHRYRVRGARVGGHLAPDQLPAVLAQAKLSVCLVRRKNRDGHVMRTYEEPAMGSCMVFENTPDHAQLFGERALALGGFRTPDELAERVHSLLGDADAREELRSLLHARVTSGANTYRDRLTAMLTR